MNQALLIPQIQPKKICVRCEQEIEGIICWKVFKWAAIRSFILVLICIPSLFFLQYTVAIIFASGIGIWAFFFFLQCCVHVTHKHQDQGLQKWQRQEQEREYERCNREQEENNEMTNTENKYNGLID